MTPRPPRGAALLLRWRQRHLPERAGEDLHELFETRLRDHGRAYARRRYWRDVLSLRAATDYSSSSWSLVMERWATDLRYALRTLRRTPGFTLVAVLTLTLGIGAATAVFAVADGAILRPFPYPDMNRLVLLGESARDGQPMSVSYPNYLDWLAQNEMFSEIGVFRTQTATVTGSGDPERLTASLASSTVFTSLGIRPVMGRVFNVEEDRPAAPPVAIVSERLWRSHFEARPDLIGQTMTLDSQPYAVVGVMPADMRFPSGATDVWLPLGVFIRTFPPRDVHPGLQGLARLKPGVTIEAARTAMAAVARRLADAYPASNRGNGVSVTSYYDSLVQGARPVLYTLLAAVGLLLVLACSNLASLMLARAETRQREFALRAAIGAGRGRLLGLVLAEAILLAVVGGGAGLGLAALALRALTSMHPTTIPRIDLLTIDWRVAGFAVMVTALTILLFALVPAGRASSPELQTSLKDGRTGGSRQGSQFRRGLVIVQVAVAALLLVGAGLVAKSLHRLMAVDLGFDPERVVTMQVALPAAAYPTPEAWVQFYQRLSERLSAVPGVAAIGLNTAVPLAGGAAESRVLKEGDPMPTPERPSGVVATFEASSSGYFTALSIPLRAGRTFNDHDSAASTPVAIVDDLIVTKLFQGASPIGRRIAFEASGQGAAMVPVWREVVGVVRHVTQYAIIGGPPYGAIYTPFTQQPNWMLPSGSSPRAMAIVARSASTDALVPTLRRTVAEIDPRLPLYNVQTMTEYVGQQVEQPRLGAALLIAFAANALVLAAVGIYGVLSYLVSRRTREIGVRLALGARPGSLTTQVLGQALSLASVGLAAGLLAAVGVTRWLRTLLFEVSPTDALTFASVVAVLAAVAFAAGLIPGRRASHVDPIVALRSD
jgi:predicted permease